MRFPVLRGLIDRRLLLNFRIDPACVQRVLPAPFRPKLLQGSAIGGICFTRVRELRPRGIPAMFGQRLESAAFRYAVQWEKNGETQDGVYISRQITSSRFNLFTRGQLLAGSHKRGRFTVQEKHPYYTVAMQSEDWQASALITGAVAQKFSSRSLFADMDQAADFFRASRAYTGTQDPCVFSGVELQSSAWRVMPFETLEVDSSLFKDFPAGAAHFDSALLMRRTEHEWRKLEPLCAAAEPLQLQEAA
jgi:hypothetical protein